ncbi:Conserved_hypothetical protein [Hexamita inflata]|uniref:Uncharacterized protein n=1 Tax=Hexamita inflata TaxID=28002 RepID=A0AA86VIQ2_9EUKA|nr:Conserved hypothetical protein [Hexamita inflata]
MMQLSNLTLNDAENIQIYLQQFKNIQITTFKNIGFKISTNDESKNVLQVETGDESSADISIIECSSESQEQTVILGLNKDKSNASKEYLLQIPDIFNNIMESIVQADERHTINTERVLLMEQVDTKKTERASREAPMMILISGLGKTGVDDVKAALPTYINVGEKGDDVCVFTKNEFTQNELKEKFPEAKFQVVASDDKSYQNAFKIQSILNWRRFKKLNAEFTAKADTKVLVVVRSNPFESRENETAKAFAKMVAKTYTNYEEHKLKFTIRGWLFAAFTEMKENKEMVDRNGVAIEFGYYANRTPIVVAKDMSVVAEMLVAVKDVEKVIKELSYFERTPVCSFTNPEIQGKNQMVDESKIDVTIDLHEMPEGTAENLEAAFKPRMPDCTFKTLANGDLIIQCYKDQLQEVKVIIATMKVNSITLKFTEKALK